MPTALPLSSFQTFGDLLKHLRRRARLTQKELSIAVGYSEAQISRLEQNQRLPDLATLAALFIPVLSLDDEPEVVARLLELAAQARGEKPPNAHLTVARTVTQQVREVVVPDDTPGYLPAPLTSFIGRAHELDQLGQWLAGSSRLLTLLGPGGAGKTRLALALAERAQSLFAHGAWFVDLAELDEPARVPQAIATVLGTPEAHPEDTQALLRRHLRPRHLLLLLDNCEHLLAAVAPCLTDLLLACPRLTVLATSREALNVPGETAWPVPALDTAESAQLFAERARAVNPGLALGAAEAQAIDRICRQLDGLPLAIELAAARLRALSPEQIAARLEDALGLLTSRQRGIPSRHQTLQATLDWSYRLLDDAEKVLLNRLSVFAGSFSLEAVEHVTHTGPSEPGPAAGPATAIDCLTALIEKSLVVVEPSAWSPRYRLLETVRQYARARLAEAGEATPMAERHAGFFLALAEAVEPRLFTGERRVWMEQLEQDLANLRAALDWWRATADTARSLRLHGALIWFWHLHRPFGEGRAQLERALEPLAWQADSTHAQALAAPLAKVAWGAGLFAWSQGDFGAARVRLEAAIRLLRREPPSETLAHALSNLGLIALGEGHLAEASALTREAVTLARAGGWHWALALLLYNAGVVVDAQGDEAAARALLQESHAGFRMLDDKWGQSISLQYLGLMAARQGQLAAALARVAEGLAMARDEHDAWGMAAALALLGQILERQGDYEAAGAAYEESIGLIVDRLGDKATLAVALHGLGRLALRQGQAQRAAQWLAAAQALQAAAGGGTPLTLTTDEDLQQDLAEARTALPEADFEAGWQAGQALAQAPETWLGGSG